MSELCDLRTEGLYADHKVRVGQLASGQAGTVAGFQLRRLGIGRTNVRNWVRAGYLHDRLPGVYAVGHEARSNEADLWAAVLYAGPGAALSHLTAAWWRGLVEFPGRTIHVSTARQLASRPGILVHGRRPERERVLVRRMPVTSFAETMLGLAACTPDLTLVRKALARSEYAVGMLELGALRAVCRHGRPGSARLNVALDRYEPRLADTNGGLEADFLVFCERTGMPVPLCNCKVAGVIVDAYFPQHSLVVELDGDANHRTPTQRRRDMRNEVTLRALGIEVVRYDPVLLRREPMLVEADLLDALARGAVRAAGSVARR